MILLEVVGSVYLGGEVESEVAVVCQRVLDHERHIGGKAQLDSARKTTSLAEVDEVLEREGQGDGLGKTDLDVLLGVLDVGVLTQGDRAVTNVTGAGKLDALLCALDSNWTSLALSAQSSKYLLALTRL